MSREFDEIRNMVNAGARIMGAIEREQYNDKMDELRRKQSEVDADKRRVEENESAYQRGYSANKPSNERFNLKEMTCPNCGATMKPDELANTHAVLGSVDCPYCGSKIVVNDDVKNAEYVHKVDVEKKRTDIEDRKLKLEEERLKAMNDHENTKATLDTIDSVNKGITKAIKFGSIAIGCVSIFIILIFIIVFVFVMSKFF